MTFRSTLNLDEIFQGKLPDVQISDEDISKLWSQARGELAGYAVGLKKENAGITAAQLVMALALADEGVARRALQPALFMLGDVKLHSGGSSKWKIECDSLTDRDIAALAVMAMDLIPKFGDVEGVPRGGVRLADALKPHRTDGPLLIVDDVCTTGRSLEVHRNGRDAVGLVIFARGPVPTWCKALFTMPWAIRS